MHNIKSSHITKPLNKLIYNTITQIKIHQQHH